MGAAVIRPIAWWVSRSPPPGPVTSLGAGRAVARAGAAMLAANPAAAAAAAPVMMVWVLVSMVVLLRCWWWMVRACGGGWLRAASRMRLTGCGAAAPGARGGRPPVGWLVGSRA